MSTPGKVTVQATDEAYFSLRHASGEPLNEDGRGEWPRDSFTFRLRDEKAIRLIEDDEAADGAASDPALSNAHAQE